MNGPRPPAPHRDGTGSRHRRRRRRRRAGFRHGCGQTGLVGRVGRRLDPASPASGRPGRRRAPTGRLRPPCPPDRRPVYGPPDVGERKRYGWGQRRAVPSGPPDRRGWWRSSGAAGESRSGRTGRPSCSCATGPYGPAARPPVPTSSRPRGANRGRSLAGRLRKAGRAMAARTPPSRMVRGQTATAASAGCTSVHEEPISAERVTASSTSWTCNASAKEGAGSTPVATASMKSRIWWVKECS